MECAGEAEKDTPKARVTGGLEDELQKKAKKKRERCTNTRTYTQGPPSAISEIKEKDRGRRTENGG
jgi:hypothetical protein